MPVLLWKSHWVELGEHTGLQGTAAGIFLAEDRDGLRKRALVVWGCGCSQIYSGAALRLSFPEKNSQSTGHAGLLSCEIAFLAGMTLELWECSKGGC